LFQELRVDAVLRGQLDRVQGEEFVNFPSGAKLGCGQGLEMTFYRGNVTACESSSQCLLGIKRREVFNGACHQRQKYFAGSSLVHSGSDK